MLRITSELFWLLTLSKSPYWIIKSIMPSYFRGRWVILSGRNLVGPRAWILKVFAILRYVDPCLGQKYIDLSSFKHEYRLFMEEGVIGRKSFYWLLLTLLWFLAHLSRRLTRWAYRIPVEPASVRPSVCQCVHTFKHEYLWNQWVDRNQILSEASLGWGKGCIWFWVRSDQNSRFHGNRKLP